MAGHELSISTANGELQLNNSKVVEADILASNGVVHLIDRLLLPEGSLALTPEKYLLALNCTRFVSLLHDANLSSLVQTSEPLTILAPNDDVFAAFEARMWESLPADGSQELSDLLRYHIVKGKWESKELQDGMLLETNLTSAKLKGNNQKIQVSVGSEKGTDEANKKVGFGDANVLKDPSSSIDFDSI
jgi:solute carrier family 25 carnitine/acylcarnitine transporter 20/29